MNRLTWKEPNGQWGVNGLSWNELLHHLQPKDLWDILYGCLHKLMQYEETGLSPENVEVLWETMKRADIYVLKEPIQEGGQDGRQEETVGAVWDDPPAGPGSVPGGSGADPGT